MVVVEGGEVDGKSYGRKNAGWDLFLGIEGCG